MVLVSHDSRLTPHPTPRAAAPPPGLRLAQQGVEVADAGAERAVSDASTDPPSLTPLVCPAATAALGVRSPEIPERPDMDEVGVL
jgi:hypothetical protein